MNKIWLLQNLNIFQNFSAKDIEFIDRLSEMEIYRKNDIIYINESHSNHVYILKNGNVKISLYTESGKEFIVEILKPGEIFGDLSLGDKENKEGFDFLNAENAFALSDVDICKFKKEDFNEVLNAYPAVSNRILKLIGLRFKYISMKIASLAYKSLDTRIAETLTYLANNFGVKKSFENFLEIDVKLTHEEISNLVGASRQRTTVALDKLKQIGIIDFYKKKIIIKDMQKLKNMT